jgi:hypothetical protein
MARRTVWETLLGSVTGVAALAVTAALLLVACDFGSGDGEGVEPPTGLPHGELAVGEAALFVSTTPPTARATHSAVWDAAGGRMVVFGGYAGSYRTNDVWTLTNMGGASAWGQLSPSGTAPTERERHSGVWDAAGSRMLVFGGLTGSSSYRNDVWALTNTGGAWAWSQLSPGGTAPAARYGHSAVWDAAGSRMLVFGGYTGSLRNDVWALTNTGGGWAWSQLSPSGTAPTARYSHSAVWDAAGSRMLVFGGYSSSSNNDVWALTNTGGAWAWSQLSPGGTAPTARYHHTAVWDPVGNRMLVFGGYSGSYYNDVWALTNTGGAWAWSQLSPGGTAPAARYNHSAVWDPAGNRMLVFGGYSYRNDVWALTNTGGAWAWSQPLIGCEDAPPTPTLLSPADGGTVATCSIPFSWSVTTPVLGYQFRVEVNGVALATTAGTSWTLPGTIVLPPTGNTWRVTAVGCPGTGAASPTASFDADPGQVPAPAAATLVAPADFVCDPAAARTFSWSGEGVGFDLVLNGARVRTGLTTTSVTLPADFGYQGTNTWQVAARNCVGEEALSAEDTFVVTSTVTPQTPTITAPANGATVYCNPTITWTYPAATTGIVFDVVATDGTVFASGITGTSWTPTGAARFPNGTAYYRVRARNCAGQTAQSGARSFVVNNTPIAPVLALPAEGQVTHDQPTFEWTVTGTQQPDVVYDLLVDGAAVVRGLTIEDVSYTLGVAEALDEGSHTWEVVARGCLDTQAGSGSRGLVVDASGPEAFGLTAPPDGTWYGASATTVTFAWEPSADSPAQLDSYEVRVDGAVAGSVSGGESFEWTVPTGGEGLCAGPFAGSGSNGQSGTYCRGSYSFNAVAGRTYTISTCDSYTGDPYLSLGGVCSGSIDDYCGLGPQLTCTPSTSGVATICASTYSDRSATWSYTVTSTSCSGGAQEGEHEWTVRAVDGVGNVTGADETWTFGIDRTAPAAFSLATPADGTSTQSQRPALAWVAATDALSGVHHYELFVDGAKSGADIPAGTLTATPAADLAEGLHPWKVVAVDRAGNRRDSTQTWNVRVDRTPPASVALLDVTPHGTGAWVSSPLPSFNFTATDNPGGSGIDHFDLFIDGVPDGGNPVPAGSGGCTTGTCRDAFDILLDGPHTWHVVAYDRVGLSATSETGAFVVETAAPLAFTHTLPANGVTVQTFYPLLCWNGTTDAGSGLAEYRVNVRKVGAADVNLTVTSGGGTGEVCVRPTAALTNGSYTWLVTAVDLAGNTREANNGARWTMTVDQDVTPPTSAITQPAADGGLAGCQAYAFAGTAADPGPTPTAPPGSGVTRVQVQVDGTGEAGWVDATLAGQPSDRVRPWTFSWTGATTGTHRLYARATDREGNVQGTATVRVFDVDCTGPAAFALVAPDTNAFRGACATFSWAATTDSPAGMGRYELRIRPSAGGADVVIDAGLATSRTLAGASCLEGGTYTWQVVAFDTLDNSTSSNTRTVQIDTQGPVGFPLLTQTPLDAEQWGCNGRQVTVTWSAAQDAGPNGGVGLATNPYQVYLDGNPVGTRRSQTTLTYTLTSLADGAHTWTVRAYDALDNWTMATVGAPLGAFRIDCTPPGLTQTASLRLYANHIPTASADTGLDVAVGERVEVWAEGQLCFADDASCDPSWADSGGCMGPDGRWTFPEWVSASKYYPDLAFGRVLALLGGDLAQPIDVGSHALLTATRAGRLRLAVNDNDVYNCRSRWQSVTVHKGPGFDLLFPPNGVVSRETRPTLRWSAVTDDGVGVSRLELLVNGAVVEGNLAADAVEYALPATAELTERDHTWRVRAHDRLGNHSETSAWTIRTDLTPPEPFSVTLPAEGDVRRTATPKLHWAPTTDSRSAMAHYLVFVDDQYNTAQYPNGGTCAPQQAGQYCSEPREALAEGRHCFYVKAQDELRWERTSTNTRCFVVDTLPPDEFALLEPLHGAESFTARPNFCWETTTDAGTGVQRYELWLSGNRVAVLPQPAESPLPYQMCWQPTGPLPNGAYDWFVRAYDDTDDGLTQTDAWRITIDRDVTPPQVAIVEPAPNEIYGPEGVHVRGTAVDGPRGTGVREIDVFDQSDPDTEQRAAFDEATGTWSIDWPVAATGTLTLCALGWDREGNATPAPGGGVNPYPCVTIRTDVSPPAAFRVLSPDGDAWVGARPTLAWQGTTDSPAGVAHYYLTIDGGAELDAGTRTSYELGEAEALPDGAHTWTARVVDALGNGRPADNVARFQVDGLPPNAVTLLTPPEGRWVNTRQPELCWNATTDRGASGLASYVLRLDGTPRTVAAGTTCLTPAAPLGDGSHSWDVGAVDRAGNPGPVSAARTVLVDVTAPPVPTPTYPQDNMHVRDNPPLFHWLGVNDLPAAAASGVCGYVVTLNGVEQTADPSANELRWSTTATDGEMTWTIRAFDCAGNHSAASAPRRLRLDTVPPSRPVVATPAEGAWVATARPTVTWTAATDDYAGICAYVVTVDGAEVRQEGTTPSYTPDADLADGSHTVTVAAEDCAGNVGPASVARHFGTDTLPPAVAALAAPAPDACVGSDQPLFTWAACTDAGAGVAGQVVLVDSVAVAQLAAGAGSGAPDAPLTEGAHTWTLRCTDAVGNAAEAEAVPFRVDLTAPTAEVWSAALDGEAIAFSGAAADDSFCGVAAVEVRVGEGEWAAAEWDAAAGEWRFAWSAPTDGTHAVQCRSFDGAGNESETDEVTLVVGPCWEPSDCDPDSAVCSVTRPADSPCDDGDACTADEVCDEAGACVGATVVCDDGNPCTDDSCDPATGCVFTANTLPCDDGSACTVEDTCGGGVCAGAAVACDDANVCTDDTCDPATGCVYTDNTVGCDDGDACTDGDVCAGGACQSGAAVVCADDNACTDDACEPATGCVFTNHARACDDGSLCTTADTCAAGACVGTAVVCDDENACTDDSCVPATGCVYANNTAGCDDGDACTEGDTCAGGACGGSAVACDDQNPCTDDSCDPATGCRATPNAAACDDGSVCTTGDTCAGGACTGAPIDCDDADACTTDACDPVDGCTNVDASGACDDQNPCTDDSCDPALGCQNVANQDPCDDGDACTEGDVCGDGACGGTAVSCDDGDVCTEDACDPASGCGHAPVAGCCTEDADCDAPHERCDGTTNECAAVLCAPCTSDEDCGPAGNRCVALPSGDRCVVPCDGAAGSCGEGAVCGTYDDGTRLCLPAEGDCECVSDVQDVCHEGDVYRADSCGAAETLVEACGGRGCVAAACCPVGTEAVGAECVPAEPPADAGGTDTAQPDADGPGPDAGPDVAKADVPVGRLDTTGDGIRVDGSSPDGAGSADGGGGGGGGGGCTAAAGGPGAAPGALPVVALVLGLAVAAFARRSRRTRRTLA